MMFSIIIPIYGFNEFLLEAIQSCLDQDFEDYEICIVDDGSPNPIEQKINEFLNENNKRNVPVSFKRIINSGAGTARNIGVDLATADYLVFLDSDDLLHRQALSAYNSIILKYRKAIICAKRFESFIYANNEISLEYNLKEIDLKFFNNYFDSNFYFRYGASNIMLPRKDFLEIGGFKKKTLKSWHGEELDLLLKLGNRLNFIFIENPILVFYRHHNNNSVHNADKVAFGVLDVIESNERKKYQSGNSLYKKSRYEKIGVVTFHSLIRLMKYGYYSLSFHLLRKSWKYIFYYLNSKLIDGKRKSV